MGKHSWFQKRSNFVFIEKDVYYIPIETLHETVGSSSEIREKANEARLAAATKILNLFRRAVTDNYKNVFTVESHYIDNYPGARLKFLVGVTKENIESFPESRPILPITQTKMKLKDLLKLKTDLDNWDLDG